MPTARKELINLDITPYYHCYNRCVRKGYLFGTHENNKNYDHRKGWVLERLRILSQGFAIHICAYAIMSNHYHLVLHVDRTQALSWSDEEVNKRWQWVLGRKILFETSTPKEMQQRRENLYSISWLMRCLNEHIARLSNKEDDVKGKFWESRFQSQALVDEGALLACMTYVDLNPIRAGIAPTLQESEYTSIQERLKAHQQHQTTPSTLMEFQEKNTPAASRPKAVLPFSFQDYELLIDWTGRQFREDKMGYIAAKVPSLVQNTGLNPANWIKTMETSSIRDQQIFGALSKVQDWAREIKKLWLKGQKTSAWKYALT